MKYNCWIFMFRSVKILELYLLQNCKNTWSLTCLFLISSFFCSKKAAGIPAMFSCALVRSSHNAPIKANAFLALRNPVKFICMVFGSGFCTMWWGCWRGCNKKEVALDTWIYYWLWCLGSVCMRNDENSDGQSDITDIVLNNILVVPMLYTEINVPP